MLVRKTKSDININISYNNNLFPSVKSYGEITVKSMVKLNFRVGSRLKKIITLKNIDESGNQVNKGDTGGAVLKNK